MTTRGRVTIPLEVRRRYHLEAGDEIVLRVDEDGMRIRPLKKRRLDEFRGIFPAAAPYIGRDAIRTDVGRALGLKLERKLRRR